MTGFINYEELFAQSIGLSEPCYVERAEFEEDSKEGRSFQKKRNDANKRKSSIHNSSPL